MSVSRSNVSPNPQYQGAVIPRAQLLSIFDGSGYQVTDLNRPEFPIALRTLPLRVECQGQTATDLSIILAVVESSSPTGFYGLLCRQRTVNPWDWHLLLHVLNDSFEGAVDAIEEHFYNYYGVDLEFLPPAEPPAEDRFDLLEL